MKRTLVSILPVAVLMAGCSPQAGIDQRSLGQSASSVATVTPAATAGRYIIKFKDVGKGKAGLQAAGIGVALDLSSKHSAVAAVLTNQQVSALANNPNVALLEKDPVRVPLTTWTDDSPLPAPNGVPFGIKMVQADPSSPVFQAAPATNVTVCIIDSGYLDSHESLRANDPNGVKVVGYSGVTTATTDWNKDGCGHGTHVAGTIAGDGTGVNGVLPKGVNLAIVRVFGDSCDWQYYPEGVAYGSELAHAMDKCVELTQPGNRLVVSMSLGGGSPSDVEKAAFDNAYDSGNTIIIAAAGNEAEEGNPPSYPAAYRSVVSVAAVDASETRADFSQYNEDVEVAAPGVAVYSTIPYSGKSTVTSTALAGPLAGGAVKGTPDTAGTSGIVLDGQNCNDAQTPTGRAAKTWRGKIIICARDGVTAIQDMVDNVASTGAAAIVVRNYDFYGDDVVPSFSATGTIPGATLSYTDGLKLLAIAGQPASVTTKVTNPDNTAYTKYNGTSMATPHASGVAALVWSRNFAVTGPELRRALRNAAVPPTTMPPTAITPEYGHGIVKAALADAYLKGPCASVSCDDANPCTWDRCVVDANGASGCVHASSCLSPPAALPAITSLSPKVGYLGQTLTVTINGVNFQLPATVTFDDPLITFNDATWYDETKLTVNVSIDATAAAGPRTLTFSHTYDFENDGVVSATSPFDVLACGGAGASCTAGSQCCSKLCVKKKCK